jgi:glycine betaine/proline transport system substrate-binding protein
MAAIAAVMMTFGGVASAGSVPESNEPIKLALNEWTGQLISSYILGGILERMGYTVEYVTAGAVPQYSAMATGSLTANPENWDNNTGDIYPKAIASGDLINIGPLGIKAQESWIYPPYMEELCPGLPDWKALFDCADAFATPETMPNGRVIDYPADWAARAAPLIEGTGLPFVPIPGGSEGAMMAELKSAYDSKEPFMMMFWAPHWIHSEYEFHWVEFPPYEPGCDTDPKLGANPDAVNDCGLMQANVSKVAWKGMRETWPAAFKVLQAYEIDNDLQNKLMLECDNRGRDVKEVTQEWIDQNEAVWRPWVDAAMM